jgi:hypothetical protein
MAEPLRERVDRWLERPIVGGETLELIRELRDLLETIDPDPEAPAGSTTPEPCPVCGRTGGCGGHWITDYLTAEEER